MLSLIVPVRRWPLRRPGGSQQLNNSPPGCGYAAEACAAALDWFAGALPGEPVVLCTQTANDRSMRLAAKLGFTEVERFEEYGAEQWFGLWSSVTPSG
jgi:RimJ/RimL family protein N-acetyltransferase